jgi:hypothetical protein
MLNLEDVIKTAITTDFAGKFGGLGPGQYHRYPCKMYKEGVDPISIKDTQAEEAAKADGFDHLTAGHMANKNLVNWFWDLEDLSPRQLVVFAQDEYQVDLPIEAGQEKLFTAVCKLTRAAPQNRNRIVLMAHTIRLNYEETLAEIARTVENPADGDETEAEEWSFVA